MHILSVLHLVQEATVASMKTKYVATCTCIQAAAKLYVFTHMACIIIPACLKIS